MDDSGVFITKMGLLLNLTMAIAKFTAGNIFHSRAMVADAWHSATDLGADLVTLAAVFFSAPGKSSEWFPWKVESLGGLAVSGMLLAGGCHMGFESAEAVMKVWGGGRLDDVVPEPSAAWIAVATILAKEWLYRASKFTLSLEHTLLMEQL